MGDHKEGASEGTEEGGEAWRVWCRKSEVIEQEVIMR
jgi:hypothetical protein